MDRRVTRWDVVRFAIVAPAMILLLMCAYMPRTRYVSETWEPMIGAACTLVVYIIPLGLSLYLFVGALSDVESRKKYFLTGSIRLTSILIFGYLFYVSPSLFNTSADTPFFLNSQGYITVSLLSALVSYLCGRAALGSTLR